MQVAPSKLGFLSTLITTMDRRFRGVNVTWRCSSSRASRFVIGFIVSVPQSNKPIWISRPYEMNVDGVGVRRGALMDGRWPRYLFKLHPLPAVLAG